MSETRRYECERCGVATVRLFRGYAESNPEIVCATCLAAAGVPRIEDRFEWWVPAVPHGADSWWDYSGVPEHMCAWWYALPESPPAVVPRLRRGK